MWFTRPQTATHPGTNRARRRATLLIETNTLRLSQAAVGDYACDDEITKIQRTPTASYNGERTLDQRRYDPTEKPAYIRHKAAVVEIND